MTASQFLAARSVLGLTQEQLAAEIGLTPHVIAAIEHGEVRCPKRIAREMELRSACAQRDAALASSGLPTCAVALELQRAVEIELERHTFGDAGFVKAANAFSEHTESCADCKVREEYARQNAPALPDIRMPWWIGVIGMVIDAPARLPRPFRVPEDESGEGRRMGLLMGTAFSALAIIIAAAGAFSALRSQGLHSMWWREPILIATAIPVAYLVGFYLAGSAVDLTRKIRHRFVGYIVRGGLAVPAIYGSIGLSMLVIDSEMTLREWPFLTAIFGVIGAFGGGLLWVIHRIRGKLPEGD